MGALGFAIILSGAWFVDSAIQNRPPIGSLKGILSQPPNKWAAAAKSADGTTQTSGSTATGGGTTGSGTTGPTNTTNGKVPTLKLPPTKSTDPTAGRAPVLAPTLPWWAGGL